MNNQGYFKLTGLVRLQIHDKDGNLKDDTGWLNNTITNSGKHIALRLLTTVSSKPFKFGWLAVGSSATSVAATDRLLAAEITASGLGRAAATLTETKTTVAMDSINFYKQWTATGLVTVNEIGIFNTSTQNVATLLGRKLTGAKSLSNTETLTANYKIILS